GDHAAADHPGEVPDRDAGADVSFLTDLAERAALAIDNARLLASARESEARFRALVQNGSDIITLVEPTGRIVYSSPAAERLLGPGALAVGSNLVDFVHPDDRQRAIGAYLAAAVERGVSD